MKGSEGIWSVTIGPLPPEIWIYNFRIEGADLPDPSNISLMPRAAGIAAVSSFVEIPGDAPVFYDARPVPHGQFRMILYESKAMEVNRHVDCHFEPLIEVRVKHTREARVIPRSAAKAHDFPMNTIPRLLDSLGQQWIDAS